MPRRDTLARKPGRPSAFTPHTGDLIESALRKGNHITTACASAGVSTSMFYRWMERANRADYALEHGQPYDRDDDRFREFRDRVLAARAHAAEKMVSIVVRAAEGGHIIEEAAAIDSKGDPIRDEDGNVIINRKYSQPNGSLALNYLKLAQPEAWAGAPGRLELSGPGGGNIPVGGDGEPDGDQVSRLATRITAAIAQRQEHDAMQLESSEPSRVDDDELPSTDVVEAEWTEAEEPR